MTTPEIRYDHAAMAQVSAALRDQATRMRSDVAAKVEEFLAAATEEASLYTADGKPAPIYKDALAQAEAAMDVLQEKVDEIAASMTADADTLDAASTEAQEIEADTAGAIEESAWVDGGWVGYK